LCKDTQEAFDRYLVKCDAPKYPLSLAGSITLIHNAGGILNPCHGNDPGGDSLAMITKELPRQPEFCKNMLEYINGLGVLASPA